MRLRILSDLHTEFAPADLPDIPADITADITILAGDTGVGLKGLELAAENFSETQLLYVFGNHEYYRHAYPRLLEKARARAFELGIVLLENDVFVHEGVRFLGCTLWTDFQLYGDAKEPLCMEEARSTMSDYRLIRLSPTFRRIAPCHTQDLHRGSRRFLETELGKPHDGPTVVVTHHAPAEESLNPLFADHPINAAYASPMDDLLRDASVDLWIHGHTHHCVDYHKHGVRVLSNQRGYPE